jgi:hypothetical protein
LSSRRLNVTLFGSGLEVLGLEVLGLAVVVRATARFSLGSPSSDIELIERLLSSERHDCANRRTPQEHLRNYDGSRDGYPGTGNPESRER